jgi:surfactin synthase thioesterase subunit
MKASDRIQFWPDYHSPGASYFLGVATMTPVDAARWFHCRRPMTAPGMRLVCLPYAGGGATVYHAWPDELPPDIEVRVLQLPGRQNRLTEPTISSVDAILDEVTSALSALPPVPLVLYGHSFGSLLAFELARRCGRSALPPVRMLMVGARRAPHLPDRWEDLHHLPQAELAEMLHHRYGMPRAVVDTPDLLELIMPSLRADMTASETHRHTPGAPLEVPIVAFRGRQDSSVDVAEMAAWRAHTSAPFELHEVDAGHFFIDTHRTWLLQHVRRSLARVHSG